MEVCSPVMGPERIFPSSEDELGEDERPVDGAVLPGGAVWVGGEEAGEMEMDGEEEEEEEEVSSGGYYYLPLNQDPEGPNSSQQDEDEDTGEASHSEQLQQVQHRIQVMGLHLPEAPSPDSDEEEDPEGAAAQRSRASIPMDAGETSTCLHSRMSELYTFYFCRLVLLLDVLLFHLLKLHNLVLFSFQRSRLSCQLKVVWINSSPDFLKVFQNSFRLGLLFAYFLSLQITWSW
uniref:Male-enhanced antigen 1 n=1 Tax=Kryptolebias marmoratus TaxID=37003 RepID=A0A3Q2Z9X2_KRYMA